MTFMSLDFQKLEPSATVPVRVKDGDAYDLYSNESMLIPANEYRLVKTGIAVAIPKGYTGLVCPRSGLALHNGLTVLNGPGVVDHAYRGEVGVLLANHSHQEYMVYPNTRIAQLLIVKLFDGESRLVDSLDDTARGSDGFGSSGV